MVKKGDFQAMISDITNTLGEMIGEEVESTDKVVYCRRKSCGKRLNSFQAAVSDFCCRCSETLAVWGDINDRRDIYRTRPGRRNK